MYLGAGIVITLALWIVDNMRSDISMGWWVIIPVVIGFIIQLFVWGIGAAIVDGAADGIGDIFD